MMFFRSILPELNTPAIALACITLFACTGSGNITTPDEAGEIHQTKQETDRAHLEELFWQRLEASRSHFVQADVDFMSKMILHHAQALIMAGLAPQNTETRSIQVLAARIINAQNDEIATMQKWLRDRNQPVPLITIDGLELNIEYELPRRATGQRERVPHGHSAGTSHDHGDMPGMLTQEQLSKLSTATGTDFNRLFLTYMIEHHEGAIVMVNELFAADGAGNDEEAYRLASDIYAEQVTEIEMMKLMLQRMDRPQQETDQQKTQSE